MHMRKLCLVLSTALLLFFFLLLSPALAAQVQLAWDAPTTNADNTPLTDLAGYKIYYGQASGSYDDVIDVGNVTSFVVSGLVEGKTYYFAATAYDFSGNESDFSNEVSFTIPGPVAGQLTAGLSANPTTGTAPLTVAFTDTSSGGITGWQWDFGDGNTSTAQNPSHAYGAAGVYEARLTITGPNGSDTATQTIVVTAPGQPGPATLYVAYDSRATRYPDWLTSAFENTQQRIQTTDVELIVWKRPLQDGLQSLPGNVYGGAQGTGSNYIVLLDPQGGTVASVTPGNYQVATLDVGSLYYIDRSYTLTGMPTNLQGLLGIRTANNDKKNSQDRFLSFTYTAAATPPPPTASAPVAVNDTASTVEDAPVTTGNVLANDTDADGDPLSVSGFSQPSQGVVTHNGDGTFTYTPPANFNGVTTFTYTVRDPGDLTDDATVTITVTAVNDLPTAANDQASTPEGTPVTIAVLSNDSDVDGGALSLSAVTQASNGTVTQNADHTVTYTPNANFNGTDTFSYTLSDGQGGTATATVTVTVTAVNSRPVAQNDTATTKKDTPVTIAVLSNDSDVDGDTLSLSAVTQASNGTVTQNADHTVTYTPNANFNGTDTFSYTLSDGQGGTATATVTVTVESGNFAMIWLEAENGSLQNPMEVAPDDAASAGQFVWVTEDHEHLSDPSQDGGLARYTFTVSESGTYVIWGHAYPSTDGTGSFFVAFDNTANLPPPTTGGNGTISGVSQLAYEVTTLDMGDLYYIDRSYVITDMPIELQGLSAIKTANNDKKSNTLDFLSFDLSQDATLYVAYDSRATRHPQWLTSAFTDTGWQIATTDVPLDVWRMDVTAGTVSLPGNQQGDPSGVGSMYLVLVDFHGQATPLPAPVQYLVWKLPPQQPSPPPTTGGNGTISGVSQLAYEVTTLDMGDLYYIDRSYVITDMPIELQGLSAIKTANNDKKSNTLDFLSFDLSQDATLYVAYDSRATRHPQWLTSAFTDTGWQIATTDVPLDVWRMDVTAGTVSLPGNQQGDPSGVGSMYLVLVDFHGNGEAPQDGTPLTWVWDQAASTTTPVFFLEPGEHTLVIKQRTSGTRLDQLLITNDLEFRP